MSDKLDQFDFEQQLINKLSGEKFIRKYWVNYPNSLFYYKESDINFNNEIGIYTNEYTYGIYI